MTTTTQAPAAVRQSACDRYDVRADHSWAVIVIDDTGLISVVSDYGNWGHWFSHHGRKTFRHFLVEASGSPSYLMEKFAGRKSYFDCDATKAKIRRLILDMRRGRISADVYRGRKDYTKELAREHWDVLETVEADYAHSADLFIYECLNEMPWLWEYVTYGLAVMVHDPGIVGFMERLWPAFVARLKEEIAEASR